VITAKPARQEGPNSFHKMYVRIAVCKGEIAKNGKRFVVMSNPPMSFPIRLTTFPGLTWSNDSLLSFSICR
jgi:hypothetical protein